jgi:drug/metabolite transporter (DMT)-like permease
MAANSAVIVGVRKSGEGGRASIPPGVWTLVGGIAIALWATWPPLSQQTRDFPPFESMTFIFLVAWLVTRCLRRPRVETDCNPSYWRLWIPALVFAFGESGSTAFFLLATRHISASEANLIIFLWPGITFGASAMFGIFAIRSRHVLGACWDSWVSRC